MKHSERPERPQLAPGVSVCARCPKTISASCCEVKPHERLATLTWADVDRLEAATGRSAASFVEIDWLDADHAQAWLDLNPSYVGYLGGAPRRLMLKALQGSCTFLQAGKGCTLDVEQRPTACRLYPFETGGRISVERVGDVLEARRLVLRGLSHACLAVEEASSMTQLKRAFGTSSSKIEALCNRLRVEVLAHAKRERQLGAPAP